MVISLSELLARRNGVKELTVPLGLEGFTLNGERYQFRKKGDVSVRLTASGQNKVLVELEGDVSLLVPCDRCLKEVEVMFHLETSQKLVFGQAQEPENDPEELSYINGYDLDVDGMVYEEILVDFPAKVLCSEVCRGICEVCGANLNDGECGCDRTGLNLRMSVIRDILREGTENSPE